MKGGHLVSMCLGSFEKVICFHCYSIYKYLFVYVYSDFFTLKAIMTLNNDLFQLQVLNGLFAESICDSSN